MAKQSDSPFRYAKAEPALFVATMMEQLRQAQVEYAIPDLLREQVDQHTAAAHHMVRLAFDIRLPGTLPASLYLQNGVTLHRAFRPFSPLLERTVIAHATHLPSGEAAHLHHTFTPEGVLVLKSSPEDEQPVPPPIAHQLGTSILLGLPEGPLQLIHAEAPALMNLSDITI